MLLLAWTRCDQLRNPTPTRRVACGDLRAAPRNAASSIATWQVAAIKHGMVDFYLRWWNGNHCIMSGFGKKLGNCNPRLAQGLTPAETGTGAINSTILFDANCGGNPLHMGLLPPALFLPPSHPPPLPGSLGLRPRAWVESLHYFC